MDRKPNKEAQGDNGKESRESLRGEDLNSIGVRQLAIAVLMGATRGASQDFFDLGNKYGISLYADLVDLDPAIVKKQIERNGAKNLVGLTNG